MGTANADGTTCTSGGKTYDISNFLDKLKAGDGGACESAGTLGGLVSSLLDGVPTVAPVVDPTSTVPVKPPVVVGTGTGSGADTPAKGSDTDSSKSDDKTVTDTNANSSTGPKATAAAPAPLVAAPAAAPALAPAALGAAPAGLLPPLAGVAPAGLASSLFSANTYDPGLLFGSPLGNAASGLFSPKADSDVTTVSQAQALASTSGGGYGTPATIGVIILACLIGFAVRHRIISRMKSREAAAGGYAPRHAAPEIEQIDPAESNDATEQVSIDDDDRTMVVLNRR